MQLLQIEFEIELYPKIVTVQTNYYLNSLIGHLYISKSEYLQKILVFMLYTLTFNKKKYKILLLKMKLEL